VKLTLADGTVELDRKFIGSSRSKFAMATLAGGSERAEQLYREAAQSLVHMLTITLSQKYGE
jgi:hypothetical protein